MKKKKIRDAARSRSKECTLGELHGREEGGPLWKVGKIILERVNRQHKTEY